MVSEVDLRLDNVDACIKCGLCQLVCPVLEVDPAFSGPKVLGPDWHRRVVAGEHVVDASAARCTFCQLCESVCPVGVPIAHLIAEHKARLDHDSRARLRDAVVVRPDVLARFPWLTRVPRQLAPLAGLSATARWPRPRPPRASSGGSPTPRAGTVGVFVDCFSRGFDGATVDALVAVLARAGLAARLLPTSASVCCGAAAWASGAPHVAEGRAREAARAIESDAEGLEVILSVNATCEATIRGEWRGVFGIEVSVPSVSAIDWLLDAGVLDALRTRRGSAPVRQRLALHTTCRATVAGEGGGDVAALEAVGFDVVETGLSCCGAAGSYAFKAEHAERARRIGSRVDPPHDIVGVAVDSATCALHLGDLWGVRATHPLVWIEEATRS